MPMCYFHLRDDKTLFDVDGTEFVDAQRRNELFSFRVVDFAADMSALIEAAQ
jgi:hypothetical protein